MYKNTYFLSILFCILFFFSCKSQNTSPNKQDNMEQKENKKANLLINESSPYLLQHAYNPVEWHAWNDEALEKAKKEDKLLLISIGYAACHWCHVMEHESFEDSTVAKLMNDNFINIKIDREERPDIDQIYMDACHLISGRGGWPLNAIALPDGKPIYAGTYYPKDNWIEVLNFFSKTYQEEPEKVLEQAENLTNGINKMEDVPKAETRVFSEQDIETLYANWKDRIDFDEGGRQGAPKFPMPNNYIYLLRYFHATANEEALKAVEITLDKMAFGGIYDHLGGGFARYSVDGIWKVPHFEKMLYDNGQLMELYAEAYQLTKKPLYKKVVYEIHEWVKREMTSKEGGFFSSLDADSEGEEGKFYVWKEEEIDAILSANDAIIFKDYYSVRAGEQWEHNYILLRQWTDEKMMKKHDISIEKINKIIEDGKVALMKERDKRIRPGLDDKVLTSWNALMTKGYLSAYRVFDDKDFLEMAENNLSFLEKTALQADFRLNRNYKDGKSVINAFLDDYALLIDAYIAAYQATFKENYLEQAEGLTQYVNAHFFDEATGMYFYTSDVDAALIAKKKEIADNVISSSNSVMANNLHLLSELFDNKEYKEKAIQMLSNIAPDVQKNGPFYANWAKLMLNFTFEMYQVAIVGDNFEEKRKELDKTFYPNAILMGGNNEGNGIVPLLKNKNIDGQTTIYVCQNKLCKLPVTTVEEAKKLLK